MEYTGKMQSIKDNLTVANDKIRQAQRNTNNQDDHGQQLLEEAMDAVNQAQIALGEFLS